MFIDISCSKSDITKNFALGIDIPSVGKFDTSQNGTTTKNGPKGESGSPFKSPQSLTISTLHPIDYSLSSEIKFEKGWTRYDDLHHIVEDMRYEVQDQRNYEHPPVIYNRGTSSFGYLVIKPNRDKYYFKRKVVNRKLDNTEGMNINGYTSGYADIIQAVGGSYNYDMSLIFIDSENYGVNPSSHYDAAKIPCRYRYVIGEKDTRHLLSNFKSYYQIPEIDEKNILIVISNHRIPESNLHQHGWLECRSNGRASVEVTDTYGNSGTIQISFEVNNWPRLKINGNLI